MKEKIDYYIKKFLFYFMFNNTLRFYSVSELKKNLEKEINTIIINNYEYMLTDSFICYLTNYCHFFIEELKSIYSEDRNKINEVVGYYFDDVLRSLSRKKELNEELPRYTEELEGNMKDVVLKARKDIDTIFANNDYNEKEIYIIRGTIISLLTECFINNDINSFNDLCDTVIDNPTLILDDIKLNGLNIEDDIVTNSRLVSIVKNQKNKRR